MAMKVEKLSSKFIKPLFSTPPNLKNYKIGFTDEFVPSIHTGVVLFYTKSNNHSPMFVSQLEKSLEKTLTGLYPLAGRYVEASQTVECNDEGVEFIQAKVNIKIDDIVGREVNVMSLDEFITSDTKTVAVVTIQLTTFECGGVALGVSATHKVVDASTLCTFLNEWAVTNREGNENKITTPCFNSSSLFPARGARSIPLPCITNDDISKYTRKKLSFSESAISNMKAKAISSEKTGSRHLSKVQLVSSIIWKALISVDRKTHDSLRESILLQPINLRGKMASLIPNYSCGNLWAVCATKPVILETTEELANLLNDSVKKAVSDYSKVHHNSEQAQMMILNSTLNMINTPESTNAILLTSWCKFPFYEADFGFGKPIWVFPWTVPMKNFTFLIDDAGGNGIEAYIFLEVKDVSCFEEALDVNIFGA